MSKKAIIIVGILVVIALGIAGFYKGYLYRPGRDISTEDASFAIQAQQLAMDYKKDAAAADKKYLNKTIEVKGLVTGVADSVVTIDSTIVCGFDKLPARSVDKQNVTVKGRCIGYDELFGEVRLDQCTIKG